MDVSKEKYMMANIKIPIEIIENNKCKLFIDLLNIDFTSIADLPQDITDPVIKEQIKDTLQIFFNAIFPEYKTSEKSEGEYDSGIDCDVKSKSDPESTLELYVEKGEIKKIKKPINTTFKNYDKKPRKLYTSKVYNGI